MVCLVTLCQSRIRKSYRRLHIVGRTYRSLARNRLYIFCKKEMLDHDESVKASEMWSDRMKVLEVNAQKKISKKEKDLSR